MDYVFLSSLKLSAPSRLVLSYDIACQWSRNLQRRCDIYPPNPLSSTTENSMHMTYLVPKFHLPAHVVQCQINYSFNLEPRVGRTDGEAPECGWSDINRIANSTKEMGPGSRRDTLDNHFGDRNWRKITQFGQLFLVILHLTQRLIYFSSYSISQKGKETPRTKRRTCTSIY